MFIFKYVWPKETEIYSSYSLPDSKSNCIWKINIKLKLQKLSTIMTKCVVNVYAQIII